MSMSSSSLAQEQLHDHPLSPIYPAIGPPSFPSCTGSLAQIDCRLRGRVTIDMLPDVAVLEIFDFYVNETRKKEDFDDEFTIPGWHTLVHVCQKWRATVFGSPHRLNLRLFCKETTPVKRTLAVWPSLPIVIKKRKSIPCLKEDNIIAALEHNDRVCDIRLPVTSSKSEVLAAMQQPFPALTRLKMWFSGCGIRPVVPETFLGGSASRLQYLDLERVPFPGLPKLLLSATDLVKLHLEGIPHPGYISPDAMARCLSTSTRLEELWLRFESPLSRPARETRRPHLPTRSILPALVAFWFEGVSEYLEDFVARIDAPQLDSFVIKFFHQLIFDTPQLAQFLARTPNTQPPVEVLIEFSSSEVEVRFSRTLSRGLSLGINCLDSDWQVSSLAQVCSSSFPEAFIPTVEHLYVSDWDCWTSRSRDEIEDSQWLELLRPFTSMKNLYLTQEIAPRMAQALQEFAGEVLPSLQNLFVENIDPSEFSQEGIEKFIAAQQLASHPIAVSHWDREQDKWEGVDF